MGKRLGIFMSPQKAAFWGEEYIMGRKHRFLLVLSVVLFVSVLSWAQHPDWLSYDTQISTTANEDWDSRICCEGSSVYIVWVSSSTVYFRYSQDGGLNWTSPIALNIDTINCNESVVCCSGDHVYVAWIGSESVSGSPVSPSGTGNDVYFRYSVNGGKTWNASELRLSTGVIPGASLKNDLEICCDGGYVYAAWEDDRSGYRNIYFNSSSNGGKNWQTDDIRLDTGDTSGSTSQHIDICCEGEKVFVVWEDFRMPPPSFMNGYHPAFVASSDIYVNASKDGGVTWLSTDTRVDLGDSPASHSSYEPAVCCAGSSVFVVWQDNRGPGSGSPFLIPMVSAGGNDIYFNRSANYGKTWGSSSKRLDTGDAPNAGGSAMPEICCSGDNIYVVYSDTRDGGSNPYFNVSYDGGTNWLSSDARLNSLVNTDLVAGLDVKICCSGENVFAVYVDCRNDSGASSDPGILTAVNEVLLSRFSADGGLTWQDERRVDPGDSGDVHYPQDLFICCWGEKAYASWIDTGRGWDVYFNTTNQPPSADAGESQEVVEGNTVNLDGTGSFDPDGDALEYEWSFLSRPNGSAASLSGAGMPTSSFLPDVLGTYAVQLKVEDPFGETDTETVSVLAVVMSYTLSVDAEQGGTTEPEPGIYSYEEGENVQVAAVPDSGYRFKEWTGDAGGTNNPVFIFMDSDKEVTARFIKQYTLTTSSEEGGSIDPAPGTYTYDSGASVTVTAVPDKGYIFAGWSGSVSGSANPVVLTMNSDKEVKARFKKIFTLTVAAGEGGTTDPVPGTYAFEEGAEAGITAVPETHYVFEAWSGDVSAEKAADNPLTLIMDRDKSVTAGFFRRVYAPVGYNGRKVENRSLSQVEYINELTWSAHPNNTTVEKYRIYETEGSNRSLVGEVDSGTLKFLHRNVDKDKSYTYSLVAVDGAGREGTSALIVVR